ncbi:MAG: Uma2 family endonuclease, partial [Crocosphaera sp.]
MNQPTLDVILTNTWIKTTWEDYLKLTQDSNYENATFYYDQGWMKIEISPIGIAQARDNSILSTVIIIYAALNNIPIKELTNCSYRKTGIREVQPDISYYVGENPPHLPRNNSPINLDDVSSPTLIIEIGSSSYLDDIGKKRLLYEQLGIKEYWVVDVAESKVIAFTMENQGSYQIRESQVLSGLSIALVEEALKRSQTEDDTTITRWLMST